MPASKDRFAGLPVSRRSFIVSVLGVGVCAICPTLRAASPADIGTDSLLDALFEEAVALGVGDFQIDVQVPSMSAETLRVVFYVLGAPVSSLREYPCGSMARLFTELRARAGKPEHSGPDLDASLSYRTPKGETARFRMNLWESSDKRRGVVFRRLPVFDMRLASAGLLTKN